MVTRFIDVAERRARLAVRHRHVAAAHTDDVVALTDGLVALHSTDPVSVYLSAVARMATPSLAAVDAALYDERSLVRHHAMRRTLWVFGHEAGAHGPPRVDGGRGSRSAAPRAHDVRGRGHRQARGVAHVGVRGDPRAPGGGGADVGAGRSACGCPRSPSRLRWAEARRRESSPRTRGCCCSSASTATSIRARPTGTWINGQYRWAATSTWWPEGFGAREPQAAAAGLARRWLAAFGPGTRADLAWWAGWNVGVTKRALADVGAVEVALDEGPGYVLPDDVDPAPAAPPSAVLLPGLDPSTMGWKQRAFHLAPDDVALLFDRNGNGGPTAWVDGRIVGGWHQRADGEIALHLTADVGADARAALEARAAELAALLGDVRFRTRFPAPLQAKLA